MSLLPLIPVLLLGIIIAQSPSFYAATILLSKTSFGQMVLFGFICSISYTIHRIMLKIFFEPLRTVEKEHLKERAWIHVTESIFALSMFRNGMSLPLALVAVGLFLLKSCFWVTIDRIDYIGQFNFDKGYHLKLSMFIVVLNFVNYYVIEYAIQQTLIKLSPWIMFGFDHLLIWIEFITFMFKYAFYLTERNNGPIEWKASFMKKVELCTEFLKFSSLVAFFSYITQFYGLPIYLLRDLYISGRTFFNKIREYIRYRKATLDMDRRYATATAQDILQMSDNTCIICREELKADYGQQQLLKPKILPCGHVFHFACLLSWLERQQSCPICRRNVLNEQPTPFRNNNNQQAQPSRVQQPSTSPINRVQSPPRSAFHSPTEQPQNQPNKQVLLQQLEALHDINQRIQEIMVDVAKIASLED